MQSMKILMSAYACEPHQGSEPGVGWHWAIETARLGHDVSVITRSNNREAITRELSKLGRPQHLQFFYYDLPAWARWWKRGRFGIHLYYLLWQWGAFKWARSHHLAHPFDAVHHITFGVIRQPSFMGRLGVPLVLGPLGGGERAPFALRQYHALACKANDLLRDAINALAWFDPWLRQMYAQASVILLKTPQSLQWLPQVLHGKSACMLEIGIDPRQPAPARSSAQAGAALPHPTLHVVYVGRFLCWKGMDLGLRAIANLRARGVPIRLTMIGDGPAHQRWQSLTSKLELASCVTWVPWMKQRDLLDAYATFDAMLFPSMHDSSGNVILEAMASGLPVVCLDLGGPGQLVDQHCGRVVPVDGLDADQVIEGLADALTQMATDPALLNRLRLGALQRAQLLTWQKAVNTVWGEQGYGTKAVLSAISIPPIYAPA